MATVTIPLSKSILEQIEGKTIKKASLTENGELELEVEDCQFWERSEKIKQEIDDGKKIEVDADKLVEHFS